MTTTHAQALEDHALQNATLAASEVCVRFGGLHALSDVSLAVTPGSIAGLVGPNGAGKSTLLGVLSGLQRANSGKVFLGGEDVTNLPPRARARRGMARTFQQPELFMGLTVREHLVVAHRARVSPHRLWRDLFDPRSLFPPSRDENERIDGLLELLQLTQVGGAPAAALPLGMMRLVEVGRALASQPQVLLLDEPLSGLDLKASENLIAVLREIVAERDPPIALVLVEHDVAAVLSLCDRVFVLDFGERIAAGTPDEIRQDPAVQTAYLGDQLAPRVDAPAEGPP